MGYLIGARTDAALTSAEMAQEGKGFAVLDEMTDHKGQRWVFATASAAIATADTVHIKPTGAAVPITKDRAITPGIVAHAHTNTYAANEGGWFMRSGNALIRVALNCLPNVNLYTSANAGVLDDVTASTSELMIMGPRLSVTASASVTNITAYTAGSMVRLPITGA